MDDSRHGRDVRTGADEPPPFGGSWARLYTGVLLLLALTVVAFAVITRHFS